MWTNIVIEGYCFGEDKGKLPCGKERPSMFCFGEDNGSCPYFACCESDERDAAWFVPLRLIIWDRIKDLFEDMHWNIRWYLWRKWLSNNLDDLPIAECPLHDNYLEEAEKKFSEWFTKNTKG